MPSLSTLISEIESLEDRETAQVAALAATRRRIEALHGRLAEHLREHGAVTTLEHVYRLQGGRVTRLPVKGAVWIEVPEFDGLSDAAAAGTGPDSGGFLEPTGADDFVGHPLARRKRPVPPEPEGGPEPAFEAAHAVTEGPVS
mgnify:CR=1 FL=1